MTRVFLFLQGPHTPFFDRLAAALLRRGHRVVKVHLCAGDHVFWRHPDPILFRGRAGGWPAFVADLIASRGVTDVVLLGDQRPYHAAARAAAARAGAAVHVTDLGYVRPHWIIFERDGTGPLSRMPHDPDTLRAMAATLPPPDARPVPGSFRNDALWDVLVNVTTVSGRSAYPFYTGHALLHPFREYAGWILRVLSRLASGGEPPWPGPEPAFLFPLQLSTDFQIRSHSPFRDMEEAMRAVLASFARAAPKDAALVVRVHPLDSDRPLWPKRVHQAARAEGIADRVVLRSRVPLSGEIAGSAGVVTVNSTVGLTALLAGRPVVALGRAIYDLPGLTHQGDLDSFWGRPPLPDQGLADAFRRVLDHVSQVRGGYYTDEAIAAAVDGAVARLEDPPPSLPPSPPRPHPDRVRVPS